MQKLKTKEIKEYRTAQLRDQDFCCALCGELIFDDAVLDHDHKTGLLRKVLHRGCNSLLGKIENNMPRSQMTTERLAVFAVRLVSYIQETHTDILHPTHTTPEERKLRAQRRAKLRRARKK